MNEKPKHFTLQGTPYCGGRLVNKLLSQETIALSQENL